MNNIERKDLIYKGKAKDIFSCEDENLVIQYFKDDTTANNAQKHSVILGKGEINNVISEKLMTSLQNIGIPTHFIKRLNLREQLVKKVEIIPVEFVIRNIAAGSISKKFGLPVGKEFKKPIVEYYFKNDDLGDPMMSENHLIEFGYTTEEELELITNYSLRINKYLKDLFLKIGIKLVDFKLEFGRLNSQEKNEIVLADEISPDTCRLWDSKTEKKLDKDRFRKDLGNIIQGYQEVARRLGIMPEETNISEVNFGKTIPIKFKKK